MIEAFLDKLGNSKLIEQISSPTGAFSISLGVLSLFYLSRSGLFEVPATVLLVAGIIGIFAGAYAVVATVKAVCAFSSKIGKKWTNRREERLAEAKKVEEERQKETKQAEARAKFTQKFRDAWPTLDDDSREVISFVATHGKKTFKAQFNNHMWSTIIGFGWVRLNGQPGQAIDLLATPYVFNDMIWDEIVRMYETRQIPRHPNKKNESPWYDHHW